MMRRRKLLTALLACLLGSTVVVGQQINMADRLPLDPEVRIGKLANGMSYYLRHNENPAGMADFYILYNVGSIQEEDSEAGLAHFLEHMAFNGTKNFPGSSMIDWLESVGLQFGTNLNAATGMEMTYYQLSQVPLKRASIIDSTLLILHDWSHFLSLEDKEIDKERGVIIEERRQRHNAEFRVGRKAAPYIYNHTRYADRDMLGTEEFLRTFSGKKLRNFYKRWYRPELESIIVVGDIDVDQVEGKIKALMADIPAAENPQPKEVISIPDNQEPLVSVISDPELTSSSVSLYIKRVALPNEYNDKVGVFNMNLFINAATSMANMRLAEIAGADAPFFSAQLGNAPLTVNNEALSFDVSAPNGKIKEAFKAAYTELERIRRYGFTESEFETFRTNLLRGGRYVYENSKDKENSSFIGEYISNYTKNTPILSAEHRWNLIQVLVYQMKLDDVNTLIRTLLTPSNNVLIATGPDKDGVAMPTDADMAAVLTDVRAGELEPYKETIIDKPLLPNADQLVPGTVAKTDKGIYESTVWTLSNGVRVVVKPTTYSPSQIQMSASANGGLSIVDDKDYFSATTLMSLVNMSGVGDFNPTELKKVIGTKVAMVAPSIGRFASSLNGMSATSDLETMLQLTYLYFTKPRFNHDQFERMIETKRNNILNAEGTVDLAFMKKMNVAMYGDDSNPRTQPPSETALQQIDFDRMPDLYNEFFCDAAGNYTFYFLGDIDMDQLKPLVEKYLGALPKGTKELAWKDDRIRVRKGVINERFSMPMQTPQSTVSYNYTGDIEYTQENTLVMAMLSACLQSRYIATIREDKGGTYGVNVNGNLSRQPIESYNLGISFKTNPKMVDELTSIVEDEFKAIAKKGPDREDMNKTLSYWLKARPDGMKNNGAWLSLMQNYDNWGEDWNKGYEELLQNVTPERVQQLAQKILDDGNLAKIIMDPVTAQ